MMELSTFRYRLREHKNELTRQQLKTLKGQALSGDVAGADKGLTNLLRRKAK